MVWVVGGASVQGTMHKVTGLPCQDFNTFLIHKDFVFLAIADGAGTSKLGHLGAQFAGNTFLQLCVKKFVEQNCPPEKMQSTLADLIDHLHHLLIEHAHQINSPIKDLATTFSGCIATPHHLIAAQIGDGFLVAKNHETFDLLLWEDNKEFINETHFLTEKNYVAHFTTAHNCSFIALGTDGISNIAVDPRERQGFKGFFQPFKEYLESMPFHDHIHSELKSFLASDRLNSKTDDDKTLLVAQWVEDVLPRVK